MSSWRGILRGAVELRVQLGPVVLAFTFEISPKWSNLPGQLVVDPATASPEERELWHTAEAEEARRRQKEQIATGVGDEWTAGDDSGLRIPPADAVTPKLAEQKGDVDNAKFMEVAEELGLGNVVPGRLWAALDKNEDLHRLFREQYGQRLQTGSNNAYLKSDLRKVAELEGLQEIWGFGFTSQMYKLLEALAK